MWVSAYRVLRKVFDMPVMQVLYICDGVQTASFLQYVRKFAERIAIDDSAAVILGLCIYARVYNAFVCGYMYVFMYKCVHMLCACVHM